LEKEGKQHITHDFLSKKKTTYYACMTYQEDYTLIIKRTYQHITLQSIRNPYNITNGTFTFGMFFSNDKYN
jgi:hypothetical protein